MAPENVSPTVTLADIQAARRRIAGKVRLSPVLEVGPARNPVIPDSRLVLKLDCLQPTGSFKVRGATNALLSLPEDQVARGLITASGGNHGLAVAYAARMGGTRAVVYLPTSAPAAKAEKLKAWGAEVVVEGAPTHHASRAAGKMVTLETIATAAGTLAPRRTEALNFELVSANVDELVLVSDQAMVEAARWLWFECGLAAELSGAAAVAALMTGAVTVRPGSTVCALVCGAGTDGLE